MKEQPKQDARPFVGSLIMLSRSAGGDLTGTNHATTTIRNYAAYSSKRYRRPSAATKAERAQGVVARAPTTTTTQITQCARRCQTTVKR